MFLSHMNILNGGGWSVYEMELQYLYARSLICDFKLVFKGLNTIMWWIKSSSVNRPWDRHITLLFFLLDSCYGFVTSLNGEVEQGAIVEAVGDKPECAQEESKTEADGSYRIRGLQVSCHRCRLSVPIYRQCSCM